MLELLFLAVHGRTYPESIIECKMKQPTHRASAATLGLSLIENKSLIG